MQTLVLCGDRWHAPETARAGLEPLTEHGFTFEWIEDAAEWSAERMMGYKLVVLTKSNNTSPSNHTPWMAPEVEQAFLAYVRAGNGLLAIHSGTADYTQQRTLRGLLGGVFVSHPPQCVVNIEPRAEHALNTGIEAFAVRDEHYHMALDDDQADVFLTARSEHGVQPAGWTRSEETGRVGVLTPGHNLEVWQHPSFQTLLRNTLRWCGKLHD